MISWSTCICITCPSHRCHHYIVIMMSSVVRVTGTNMVSLLHGDGPVLHHFIHVLKHFSVTGIRTSCLNLKFSLFNVKAVWRQTAQKLKCCLASNWFIIDWRSSNFEQYWFLDYQKVVNFAEACGHWSARVFPCSHDDCQFQTILVESLQGCTCM